MNPGEVVSLLGFEFGQVTSVPLRSSHSWEQCAGCASEAPASQAWKELSRKSGTVSVVWLHLVHVGIVVVYALAGRDVVPGENYVVS